MAVRSLPSFEDPLKQNLFLSLFCHVFFLFFFFVTGRLDTAMTILSSLPLFNSIFNSTSKRDRFAKQIGSFSAAVIKRQQQPFSVSAIRAHPQVKSTADTYSSNRQSHGPDPDIVTESSILSAFPRPNLMPTLHFSLFGLQNSPPSQDKEGRKTKCSNCAGPHSTDFCPC